MRGFPRSRKLAVCTVPGVHPSLAEDIRQRGRRYAWPVGIRAACFLATVATRGVLQWVLFPLAPVSGAAQAGVRG